MRNASASTFRSGTAAATPSAQRRLLESALSQALGLLSQSRTIEALACLAAFSPSRSVGHMHCNLVGKVLLTAGANEDALGWFDAALAAERRFPEAAVNRAHALARLGRHAEAAKAFQRALRDAADETVHFAYATTLMHLGQHADAVAAYSAALKLRPAYPDALRGQAAAYRRVGSPDQALACLDRALHLDPTSSEMILDKANLLHAQERLEEALTALDTGLQANPAHTRLWNNRGIVLHDLGRMAEALASLDQALRLDPASAQAHHNRGNVLVRLTRCAEGVAAFDRAIAHDPAHVEAMASRGLALKLSGRFDEAMRSLNEALALDPNCIHARANRGELKLLLGDFSGWSDYEFRFFTERQTRPLLKRPVPEWNGEARPGARIVVLADQGNGDAIQFVRFLPQLVATGAIVTFLCPPRLQRLLRPVCDSVHVVGHIEDDAAFDCQITLSSMPGAFRTDLASLAQSRPYLSAEPERVRVWADRLGSSGFKVGLCWRGNQAWQVDPLRSIPLTQLQPILDLPDVRLISLQMPDNLGSDEGCPVSKALQVPGPDFDSGPDAFLDTAAVMACLDLVITCDTSIAHLAGALGRPTAVLLQSIPEWRWMLERSDSPWYPTMRLYRQTRPGDWAGPVSHLAADLARGALPSAGCVQA